MVGRLTGSRGSDATDFTTIWSEMRGDVRGILETMLTLKKTAIGTWLVFAWVLPAAIAGALGWRGIWGSRSAFGDYLLPLPMAAGFLHLLTLGGILGLLVLSRRFPDALRRLVPAATRRSWSTRAGRQPILVFVQRRKPKPAGSIPSTVSPATRRSTSRTASQRPSHGAPMRCSRPTACTRTARRRCGWTVSVTAGDVDAARALHGGRGAALLP
jgi:hypothetical protein